MMMRLHRRAILSTSTTFSRSFPRRSTLALSRATSVPEPIAIPTLASISAGASLIPSPTIATVLPAPRSSRTRSSFCCGSKLRLHIIDLELTSDRATDGSRIPREKNGSDGHLPQCSNSFHRLGPQNVGDSQAPQMHAALGDRYFGGGILVRGGGRNRHAVLQEKCSGSDDGFLSVHLAGDAFAGSVGKSLRVCHSDVHFVGRLQNGPSQGMLAETLRARSHAQQAFAFDSGGRIDRNDLGIAERERSGFIEHNGVHLAEGFHVQAALHDRAVPGCSSNGAEDGQRCTCRNAARAGHDHHRNRRAGVVRKDEGEKRAGQSKVDQVARETIRRSLHWVHANARPVPPPR